jgi:methanogenic corrinoid protein MtbC1
MGQYFESGKISVEQEHLFSKTINEVISSLTVESGEGGDGVVLFPADENIHSIGLNFFRFLVIQKVSGCVEVLDRGPRTLDEFVKMIEKRHPKIMGIGFALPTQIDYLRQILHWCDEYKGVCNIPLIMAGGPAASEISSFSDLKGKIFISDAYDTKSAVAYIVRICGSFTRAH